MLKKNIFSVVAQTLIQACIFLVLYRYLLDVIGIEKIGIWSIILATTSVAKVSEMGLGGSITKFVATYQSKKEHIAASESLQTAGIALFFGVAIVLLLLYPLLKSALIYFLPKSGIEDGIEMLPYALLSLWISSVANIWLNGLDGCLRSDLRAILMVLGSLVFLVASMILVKPYGLVGLAIAQILQSILLLFSGWFAIRKELRILPIFPYQWRLSRFKEMLGYGVNFQINSIIMLFFDPTAKILLGKFSDLATVGYFEMAQRLITMARNLIIQSNRVIVPVFAGIDLNEASKHEQLYAKNLRYLFFVTTPLFAIILGLTPVISEVWLGEYQSKFVIIASSLSFAWYLNSITAPAYFAYLGQGKLLWVTVSHIVMGLINISFGYFLGNIVGWQGVVFSFCLALVIGGFIPALIYQKNIILSINDIFSRYDVILFIVGFGASAIVLVGYYLIIDIGIRFRIALVVSWILFFILFSIWIHPIRKDIVLLFFKKTALKE